MFAGLPKLGYARNIEKKLGIGRQDSREGIGGLKGSEKTKNEQAEVG